MTANDETKQRKRRLARWVIAASAVVFPLPALVIAARTYRAEKALFFPRRAPVAVAAAQAGLPGLTGVELGAGVRGWFVPPRNDATVVLLHGAGADRSQLLPEARLLVERGFGALAIDWPGHGESAGEVRWADGERAALAAAVDWLAPRTERIGAYGFSMGGYILSQVAAREPRIAAVVLAGTPADVLAQSRWQWQRYSVVSQLPARWALARGGLPLSDPQPRALVAALAPRPLLVVGATRDFLVPGFMAQQLHDAAGAPKELYVVDAAIHGGYHTVAPAEYAQRLTAFFEKALPGQRSGTGAAK